MSDVKDSVDGYRVTTQALLQLAAQSQRDLELMQQRLLKMYRGLMFY